MRSQSQSQSLHQLDRVVHVETSDSECPRSRSSSDISSASISAGSKKVHFDKMTKKSALKVNSKEKHSVDSRSDNDLSSSSNYSCKCGKSESKSQQAKNKEKKSKNQTQPNQYNKSNNQGHNQRNQARQGQIQNNQGNLQSRTYYPRSQSQAIPSNNNSAYAPYRLWGPSLRYWPQYRNMVSRTILPYRAVVVHREDVVECPSDPRPNAFFDVQSGILRVYHGSVYGNSYAMLVPNPADQMPISAVAPQAARSSGPPPMNTPIIQYQQPSRNSPGGIHNAPNQLVQQPMCNNGWFSTPNQQECAVPGSWPNDNNDNNKSGFGRNNNDSNQMSSSGWANNNNSSNWGGDNPSGGDGGNTWTVNNNSNSDQSSSWGAGVVDGANDNQQSNNTWEGNSNNQHSSNNNTWAGNQSLNNNTWGGNSTNNSTNMNNSLSPRNNGGGGGNNDNSWSEPKVPAPWGDMSAAQSTQADGNNRGNNNSGSSWSGGGNDNSNNNTNSNWADGGTGQPQGNYAGW
jgi:hypothetical protein